MEMLFLAAAIAALALAYDAYVTRRLLAADCYAPVQLYTQLAIVWLVPFAGAILVHWILHLNTRERDAPPGRYRQSGEPEAPELATKSREDIDAAD